MTDTLTPEKLEELKALALAATPGPWTIDMENEWDDGTNLPEQLNLRVNGSRWGKVVDAVHVGHARRREDFSSEPRILKEHQ